MTKMRNLVENIDKAQASKSWNALESPSQGVAWASQYSGPEHIVYGHDAKRSFVQHPFATGLDSGCCYGGELTAMMLPARQFLQIESKIPISRRKEKHKHKPLDAKSRIVEGNADIMCGVPDLKSLDETHSALQFLAHNC